MSPSPLVALIFASYLMVVSSFMAVPHQAKWSSRNDLKMSYDSQFNPKLEAGVSEPFGFFDPLGISPITKRDFSKYRESELKHGRVAMLAVLGVFVGEKFPLLFGSSIGGPAIFQYQVMKFLTSISVPFTLH